MSETHGRRLRAGRRAAVLGGRQAAADWAGRTGDFLSSIYDWVAARIGEEADTARLAPWLAVGFGMGILLYFAAPSEPSLYAPAIVLLLFSGNAWSSREAGLIVVKLDVPPGCIAPVIDRRTLATTGEIALRRADGKWIAEFARSPSANRPWFGRASVPDTAALSRLEVTNVRAAPRETETREIDDVPVPDLPEAEDVDDDAQ